MDRARLLTSTQDTPRQQVFIDVAHEALIRNWDKIQTWMAEGREAARLTGILREALLEWKRADKNSDFLFQGARLVQMEDLVDTHASDLTGEEVEFVQTGVKLREAKEKEKNELIAAKTKTVNRGRIIILIVLIALVSLIYFSYSLYLKEKKVRLEKKQVQIQLARNYWEKSRQAREDDRFLMSLHLFGKAVEVNPNLGFHNTLLLDMNEYWKCFPLLYIFQHPGIIGGARFDSDGTRILTWSNDGTIRLWNVATGKLIGKDMKHQGNVNGATFNRDETCILTWSVDKTARLWDAATGKPIGQEMKHRGDFGGAVFNRDGTRILTLGRGYSSNYGNARLWDSNTGKSIGPAFEHEGLVEGARFNADESRILTWSRDGTARLWDIKTGKSIGPALEHKDLVWGALFNSDETRIITWSRDGSACIWNIGVDWDFPKDKIKLQVWALTGTEMDFETREIKFIEPQRWRELKKEYMEFAREHYKKCKYPHANVFRKLFPEEAEKIRKL